MIWFTRKEKRKTTDSIIKVIKQNRELHESILYAAHQEVSEFLEKTYKIKDKSFETEIVKSLLGEKFMNWEIETSKSWDQCIKQMSKHFEEKVKSDIISGKELVLWSGFGNEYHELMNGQFNTIENTTIGNLRFLEATFPNWKNDENTKLRTLWAKLSQVYMQSIEKQYKVLMD